MNHLIFSLNATIPLFFMMLLGIIFRRIGLFTEDFSRRMNRFVFRIALPALLFQDLSQEDFFGVWDGKYVIFCFLVSLICIGIAFAVSFLLKDRSMQGELIQASYRSSAALLGIGFIQNIYGNSGMAPLMILATVPLYNIMAVVVLSFLKPGERGGLDGARMKKTLKGIVTNPIILGIVVGMLWSVLKIPQPQILSKSVHYIANLATPLGLMSLGAAFDLKKAWGAIKPTFAAVFMKLCVWCMVFLPLAIYLGFREDKLIAILVMLGSPTTSSSFIMAQSMGHDGTLTASVVMATTLGCAFTMTLWLFLLRFAGLV